LSFVLFFVYVLFKFFSSFSLSLSPSLTFSFFFKNNSNSNNERKPTQFSPILHHHQHHHQLVVFKWRFLLASSVWKRGRERVLFAWLCTFKTKQKSNVEFFLKLNGWHVCYIYWTEEREKKQGTAFALFNVDKS